MNRRSIARLTTNRFGGGGAKGVQGVGDPRGKNFTYRFRGMLRISSPQMAKVLQRDFLHDSRNNGEILTTPETQQAIR